MFLSTFSCDLSSCYSFGGSFLPEILHGSKTVKQEPFPSLLSTETLPFIRSVKDFTMRSPRPVPMIPLSEELFSRVNASSKFSDIQVCPV